MNKLSDNRRFRVSFRTVAQQVDNPTMRIAHPVDYDTTAKTPYEAIEQIMLAHYYYKINPYCWVFYNVEFGNVFVKEY